MEITKELKQDLSELESACSSFLGKYESQLTDALNKTKMSAEDSLKIDLMLELVTHLSSAQFVSSYMQKDIVKEGILLQDAAGNFTLGGDPLPTMSDIEVYVHDDELNQDVWKRVSAAEPKSGSAVCAIRISLPESMQESAVSFSQEKSIKKIRQHTVRNYLRYPDRSFFFIS